jgi:hypothetical protein
MDDSLSPEPENPDPACGLNGWLKDNWGRLHALARADQLPVLAPPRSDDDDPPADGADAGDAGDPYAFDPVPLRARLDGWTAERQVAFIEALAESACVADACRSVVMSQRSAYALRARPEAISFRNAWETALDYGMRRLSDAVLSRAINGVATPVFYQGEQVGERRQYDERLALFLLQRRDPLQYGAWRDRQEWDGHREADALGLLKAKAAVREDADLGSDGLANGFARRLGEIASWMRGDR